jgi:hypothetical protein
MMPLSTTDVQVLKLLNTPKLPTSLFDNAQPIAISVLKVADNQATILMAGRQIQTQTTIPLTVGQQLSAQPEMVNGQLQLKLIPNPNTSTTNLQQQTAQATAAQQVTNNNSNPTQLLKILNAPQTITNLFSTAQATPAQVLSTNGNQANLLIAGQTLRTQSNATLSAGQILSLVPEEVDGELQLRMLPNSIQGQAPAAQPKDSSLPLWTNLLPRGAKEALGSLKTSLPTQTPMNELMRSLTQALPNLLSPNSEGKTSLSTSWQSFLSAALTTSPAPTAERVQQSVIDFNPKLSDNKINSNPIANTSTNTSEWKKDLISLINNPQTPLAEKQLAQGILAKNEQTQQIQNLHQMAGQAVLLQEIPINTAQGLDNFTLEIDVPKPDTPEQERQWKIFIQLQLPEGDFTSRVQMDKDLNVRLQLWGDNDALSRSLQAQAPALKAALQEQGLTVESLIVAQGKPASRTEQPPWHQPLVDVHG